MVSTFNTAVKVKFKPKIIECHYFAGHVIREDVLNRNLLKSFNNKSVSQQYANFADKESDEFIHYNICIIGC